MKRENIPGIFLAILISTISGIVCQLPIAPFTIAGKHPIEGVMMAIIIGLLFNNLFKLPRSIEPGAKYCLKSVLAMGIIFMGSKLNFFDVMKLGGVSIVLVITILSCALASGFILSRIMKIQSKLGILITVGCSICGGSAIAATAPVVDAKDEDISFAVGTITILGLVAMFIYPLIAGWINLSTNGFGLWAGTSIHNTPQVVAAGMMYSPASGEVATTVKMVRNLFIAPVVIFLGYFFKKGCQDGKKLNYKELFPMFILGFLAMALVRTYLTQLGLVGSASNPAIFWTMFQVFERISAQLIVIAMAGIGLTTNLVSMKKLGLGGLFMAMIITLIVAGISLALIFVLKLN